jgi:hypothetical protein
LRWYLGVGEWDSTNLNVAVYLCNQMIYSPRRRRGTGVQWHKVSETRPLRCVLSFSDPAEPQVARWLKAMQNRYRLTDRRPSLVNMAAPQAKPRIERYVVFEFVPKRAGTHDGGERERIGPASVRRTRTNDRDSSRF